MSFKAKISKAPTRTPQVRGKSIEWMVNHQSRMRQLAEGAFNTRDTRIPAARQNLTEMTQIIPDQMNQEFAEKQAFDAKQMIQGRLTDARVNRVNARPTLQSGVPYRVGEVPMVSEEPAQIRELTSDDQIEEGRSALAKQVLVVLVIGLIVGTVIYAASD